LGCFRRLLSFTVSGSRVRRRLRGSLIDELRRREAAARTEAGRLRGQIAELAERLAGVEEQLSRLVIAREVVDEVLGGAAPEVSPASGQPEVTAWPGAGHSPVIGVLAVPPWRAGLEVSVLPLDYRDLLEVAEDAGRPLRAAQIAAAAGPSPNTRRSGHRYRARRNWKPWPRTCAGSGASRPPPRGTASAC
jgi:hypothetical protein